MSAPAAVRRQAKASEDLVRELNARPADAAAIAAQAAPAPSVAPPNLPEVGAPPPSAQPVAQPAAAAAPADPTQPVDYEHKFKVLEGKYRAEVPRLLETVNEQRAGLEAAARLNQELQARVQAQGTPQQPQRREDQFQLVSEKEREEFGPDLVDMVGRRAQEAVLPAVQQILARELQPLKQSLASAAQTTVEVRQQAVYNMLNAKVPDWEAINISPEFLAWLEVADVFSGLSRRIALANAWNAGDAPRVAGIFEAYKREDASTSTSGRTAIVAPETLIAPGAPRGSEAAPGSSRGKIWSESDIRNFYDRVRRKQVKPEEYAETSAEIALAVQQGRVKPDRVDIHSNR